jgi:hypothetical protein
VLPSACALKWAAPKPHDHNIRAEMHAYSHGKEE